METIIKCKQIVYTMDFIKEFEKNVKNTIKEYSLFDKRSRVLVACSGGKDSTVALYLIKKLGYNVEALTIDLGIGNYSKKNLENTRKFCKIHNIKLNESSFTEHFGCSKCKIERTLKNNGVCLNSCSICGVLRRYLLNKLARELKFDVIVTGHNIDDEAQAILMNFLRNTMQLQSRLGPKAGLIKNAKFVPRVKPLYFSFEDDIRKYSKMHNFELMYEKCPCSSDSFRNKVREALNSLPNSRDIKKNIVDNFLEILPKLKNKYLKEGKLCICDKCGEPSSEEVCTTCKLLENLKL